MSSTLTPRARQAHIADWMRHGGNLPHHPAINRAAASWSAQELLDGLRIHPSRATVLADLHAMRSRGIIRWLGTRAQYAKPGEDQP